MRIRYTPQLAAMVLLALPIATAQVAADASMSRETSEIKVIKQPNIEISGESTQVSRGLSSSISSILPKFAPPKKETRPPDDPALSETYADEPTEVDDPDQTVQEGQPRNKIIRLPKMVVLGERPPVFSDKELNSKKGLGKVAAKKYLSTLDRKLLNRYTIPFLAMSAEQRALIMYEEDERIGNIEELKEDADNAARAGDKDEAAALRRESNRTFMRSGGMDWTKPKD